MIASQTVQSSDTPPLPIVTALVVASARLRSTPSFSDTNTIEYLKSGMKLQVVSVSQDGSWYQVISPDNKTGWISANQIKLTGKAQNTVPTSTIPTPTTTTHP